MSAPNNEPAFPAAPNPNWTDEDAFGQRGMTLRDYFAGQALIGVLRDPSETSRKCAEFALEDVKAGRELGSFTEIVGKACYAYADAMLAARQTKAP